MARPFLSTPAIVLRTVDFGESDRIVTVLSRDFGKFTGIAKGAKRSRKRFSGALEIFARIRLDFHQRRDSGMAFLERAVVRAPWPALVQSMARYGAATHVIEVADKISAEHEVGDDLFQVVDATLATLGSEEPGPFLLRLFELAVLSAGGWHPHLDHCLGCRRLPETSRDLVSLEVEGGGVRCSGCARDGGLRLRPETLACMRRFANAALKHRTLDFGVQREVQEWLEPLCRKSTSDADTAAKDRAGAISQRRIEQELRTATALLLAPRLRSPLRALDALSGSGSGVEPGREDVRDRAKPALVQQPLQTRRYPRPTQSVEEADVAGSSDQLR